MKCAFDACHTPLGPWAALGAGAPALLAGAVFREANRLRGAVHSLDGHVNLAETRGTRLELLRELSGSLGIGARKIDGVRETAGDGRVGAGVQ